MAEYTIEQLGAALIEADRKGDKVAATELTLAIRTQQAASQAVSQPTPLPAASETPEQRNAREITEAYQTIQGQNAGTRAIGQGIRQFGQGIRQAATEGLEALNVLEPGSAERYTQAAEAQAKAAREDIVRDAPGLKAEDLDVTVGLGQYVMPIVATPAMRATTFLGSMFTNALLGGSFAGTQFKASDEDTSRLSDVTWGAALGALVGAVPGAAVGMWNWTTKTARELLDSPAAIANRAALDRLGIRLSSIGQETGDPRLMGLEAATKGPSQLAMANEQVNTIAQNFDRYIDRVAGPAAQRAGSLEQVGPVVAGSGRPTRTAMATAIREQLIESTREAKNTLDHTWRRGIDELVKVGGTRPIVQVTSLARVVNEIARDHANVLRSPSGTPLPAGFEPYRTRINELAKSGANAEELNDLLIGANNIMKGRAKVLPEGEAAANAHMAATMRAAIFDDMGASAGQLRAPNQQAAAAARLLLQVRASYRTLARRVDNMADSALAAAFGKKTTPKPKEMASFLRNADPEDARSLVRLMEHSDPESLRAIRGETLRNAWTRSFDATAPQASAAFNLAKFVKEINRLHGSGIFTKTQAVRLAQLGNDIRVIFNRVGGSISQGPATMPSSVTMQAVSRNAAFIARAISEHAEQGTLDRILFTRVGQEAIRTLARTGSTSAQMTAAVGVLAGLHDRPREEQPEGAQ